MIKDKFAIMANYKIDIPLEILNCLNEYQFQTSPGREEKLKDILKSQVNQPEDEDNNKLPSKLYKKIAEEIGKVILEYLQKRPDDMDQVFTWIEPKLGGRFHKEDIQKEFLENGGSIPLINWKTAKELLLTQKASKQTIQILKAFEHAVMKEREELGQLESLYGDYQLYNLDNTEQQWFQISLLMLRPDKKSKLRYFSSREKLEEQSIRLEAVGEDKLLIHFVMDDCRMFFYANVGRNRTPKILQPVYIYNNRYAQPVASLAVMRRITNQQKITPERGLQSTGDIQIDRFLKHRAHLLTAQFGENQHQQFDMSDLAVKPGLFGRDALHYEKVREKKGLYKIYFCERYPSSGKYQRNSFYSTVGVGYLRIFEDAFGRIGVTMKSRQDSTGRKTVHEGMVVNDALCDGNYMIIQMYRVKDRERAVSLFLMLHSSDVMFGSHNIMYDSLTKMGCGAVILRREHAENERWTAAAIEKKFDEIEPEVILPTDLTLGDTEQRFINYLSVFRDAHVSPVNSNGQLTTKYPLVIHQGVYKMYSYGKGGIRMGVMKIYPSGFVSHSSVGAGQEEVIHAYGRAQLIRQSLYIHLENPETKRLGLCIFKTEGEMVPVIDKTVFTGTFCGVTRRNGEFPLASRLILEFVSPSLDSEDISPFYLKYGDRDFEKIPKQVRIALKGRAESMIGFFKNKSTILNYRNLKTFNKQEADKSEAFLNAAVYESVFGGRGKTEKAKLLLEKAEKYGHPSSETAFDEKLKEQIGILYERAAYQLVVRKNPKMCLDHLEYAKELSGGDALDLEEFENAVGKGPLLDELKEKAEYKKLA